MTIMPFAKLACPLDGAPLQARQGAWYCPDGHNFDIARQGYVNLLPVQNKRSRDPGDSKEMIVARQQFLAGGYYQQIADEVARTVFNGVPATETLSCLDAGCGEGHYLRELAAFAPPGLVLQLLGVDISKWAAQAAARRDARTTWVVGSNANLPVLSSSLDRVLCMFGFPVYAEFLRVLRPGGLLLMVDAGPDHLLELREIIYPVLKEARRPMNQVPSGFSRVSEQRIRFSVLVPDPQQIGNLLMMTPHLYRATAEGRSKVAELSELRITVDVTLCTLLCQQDRTSLIDQ